MKSKRTFGKALVYDWPLYLVLPVVGGMLIFWSLGFVHQPKPYEKVNVFVGTKAFDAKEAKKELQSLPGCKEATIVQSDPDTAAFYSKLQVVGYSSSDIFLLPERALKEMNAEDILFPFVDHFKNTYVTVDSPSYYEVGGVSYGLLVKEKNMTSSLEEEYPLLNENYYLCLSGKSKNLGNMGLYENEEYHLALDAFLLLEGHHA